MNSSIAMPSTPRLLLSALLALMILSAGFGPPQSASAESDDAAVAIDEDLRFMMVAVGDHPKGYFSDLEILPGGSEDLEVAVINVGNVPVNLRIYNANAHNGLNGGFLAGDRDEELEQPASWVSLPEQLLTLDSSEQIVIPLTVSVPENTPGGQYISALVVETADTLEVPGTSMFDQVVRYSMSLGVLVPGDLHYSLEIGEPGIVDRFLSIPVENTGNYLIKPVGRLQITDTDGYIVAEQVVELDSVYAGYETEIAVHLPDQLPHGEYRITLELTDPASGASGQLDDAPVLLAETEVFTGVLLADYSIVPNDEEIVFASVSVNLDNAGPDIGAASVILKVDHDGETVEEFPLATNQILVSGANILSARYLPASMWNSGTYTFSIIVYSVDPRGGQQIELLNEELDAKIVVP